MSRFAIVLLVVAACRSEERAPAPAPTPTPTPTPTPPPAPAIDRAALLAGQLPESAQTELINAQCRICHSTDYLTQQRLSEPAWKKTIDKMRKFGANLTDAEAASLVAFAARYWNPDLPPRAWSPVPLPAGALPLVAPK